MSPHPVTTCAACLLLAGSVSASDLVLDDFTDTFPDQTLTTIVFTGLFIGTHDGVTHAWDQSQQDGLSGVHGGQRDAYLVGPGGPGTGGFLDTHSGASAAGLLTYSPSNAINAFFGVEYGARTGLDLDVTSCTEVVLRGFNGSLDDSFPTWPIQMTVTLKSGVGTPAQATQSAVLIVLADGDYEVPVAQFPLIDFGDLDYASWEFDGTQVLGIDFEVDSVGLALRDPLLAFELVCLADQLDCPCGNESSGTGCVNGSGLGGRLEPSGTGSIAADDAVLHSSQLPPNEFGIYFATGLQARTPFGNGIVCTDPSVAYVMRLNPPVQSSPAGDLSCGPGLLATLQGQHAHPLAYPQPGDTLCFQHWYRDTGSCGTGFNFTSAVRVTYEP